jgi:hypothetical protein
MSFNLSNARHRAIRIVLCVLIVISTGCVSTKGKPIPKDAVIQIQKGITTKTQILELFGAPNEITYSPKGEEILVYKYGEKLDLRTGQAVGTILKKDIPGLGVLLDLGTRKVSEKEDRLMVFMDDKGIVQNVGFTNQTGK